MPHLVLGRFCLQILPEIHTLVESRVVERSLSAGHYPRSTNLTLLNIDDDDIALRHFTGTTISIWMFDLENSQFAHLFQRQISSLKVIIVDPGRFGLMADTTTSILAPIFPLFNN